MYKMFGAEYEAPKSQLYADLEGEQVGIDLLSAKQQEKLETPPPPSCARWCHGYPMAAFDRYNAFRNFDGPPGLALGLEEINRSSADTWMQRQISKLQSSSSET
eukprot:symbB.v1.2.026997.t1/scaffold2741.1/size74257/1